MYRHCERRAGESSQWDRDGERVSENIGNEKERKRRKERKRARGTEWAKNR